MSAPSAKTLADQFVLPTKTFATGKVITSPHIFTPLYRSDASRNSRTGGAGLGLSIARSMLRAHGGDLTAANRPEGGAVFEGTIS